VKHRVYGQPRPTPEVLAYDRRTFEAERSLDAFDGDDLVATAATATLELSVPGGASLPMGGLRAVSVLPTHRRRGILTLLVDHALAAGRERGEVLMVQPSRPT
jgi:GNAT superfamily N-acetyltransferase